MRKLVLTLVFLLLAAMFFSKKAQSDEQLFADQTITQYLPHFVAGKLSLTEWESKVFVDIVDSKPHSVMFEFFDDFGNPANVFTDHGYGSIFVVDLIPGAREHEEISILKSNNFLSGWIRVKSPKPISLSLKFQQFILGGNESIGQATVFPSPMENMFVFQSDLENGIALANPG
ncbi:MAG: hypothetical protein AAB522_00695, partial [Patescibacteria group bacterium]